MPRHRNIMTWILPFFESLLSLYYMHQKNQYIIYIIHIHYTSLYHDSYMLHTQSPLHSMNSIRLPLPAPNHHAIGFFGADTFEPRSDGAVAPWVLTGGREETPPTSCGQVVKGGTYGNHKVLTLSTGTISTDHKNVMSRSSFLDHNIPNMHPIFFNKFILNW